MLGDDLGDLLGHRIPADHSRQVLADHYAERLRARRVMDLGCGTGDSVDLFRSVDSAVEWVGVDIEDSPEVAERRRTDAEFVTYDGRRLPFGDASFELVYCKQVLEHVEHPRELIGEVARVLEPGGRLAGSTSQLEAFHSRSIFNTTPYGFTRVAEDAGLEVVELRPVIDGFTMVAWRALGLPRFFHRWWARESPPYGAIVLAGQTPYCRPRAGSTIGWVRNSRVGLYLGRRRGFGVNHPFFDRLRGCHVGAHGMSLYDGASQSETRVPRGAFRPRRDDEFKRTWTQVIALDLTHESGPPHAFAAQGTITIRLRRLTPRAARALESRLRAVPRG